MGQMTDVGFVVKSFPQIGLIEPAVISYAENKAGSCLSLIHIFNLMPGTWPSLGGNDQVYSGEYLMTVGLGLFTGQDLSSRIIEMCIRDRTMCADSIKCLNASKPNIRTCR